MLRLALEGLQEGERELSREARKYLRVRRLEKGDAFVAFDPVARLEAEGVVLAAGRVSLQAPRAASALPSSPIVVIQCTCKGGKLDQVVRDATELGATCIVAAVAERSIKRQTSPATLMRWQRIAIEAARQCGRGDVPEIVGPILLAETLQAHGPGLLLHPAADKQFADYWAPAGRAVISIAIGPEGGFSNEELATASRHGFTSVRLGQFVMRTETACAAALGAIAALGRASPSGRGSTPPLLSDDVDAALVVGR